MSSHARKPRKPPEPVYRVRTVKVNERCELVLLGLVPVPCGCGCGVEEVERHMVPYRGRKIRPSCFVREQAEWRRENEPYRNLQLWMRARHYLERTSA